MLQADFFGNGDLDMINEITIPQRLKYTVGKPKDQKILDGFLAEIVIDTINLRLVKVPMQYVIQMLSACEVSAERFFHDESDLLKAAGNPRTL